MADDVNLSVLIDKYVHAILSGDESWIENCLKNLHDSESKIEPEIIQPFLDLLKSDDSHLREAGAKGLGEFGDYGVLPFLLGLLQDANSHVRQAAIQSIGKIGDLSPIDNIVGLLKDVNPFVREEAAVTLGLLGCSKAVEPLIDTLNDENLHVQRAAILALGLLEDIRATQPLSSKLKSASDKEIKLALIQAIGDIGDKNIFEPYYKAIENVNVPIDLAIYEAIDQIDIDDIVDPLVLALQDKRLAIRNAAQYALNNIGSQRPIEHVKQSIHENDISEPDVIKKDHGDYIISKSGVIVWKSPQVHPSLCHTNINHPDFLRKAAETFPKGLARGLPRICSNNSEDARTWLSFSPLLESPEQRALVLANLLNQAFTSSMAPDICEKLSAAQLYFWYGRRTPSLELLPPPTLPFKEGLTEVDLMITVENKMIVFVETKFHADLSPFVKNCPDRDQAIRMIDAGSWYARGRFDNLYFVFLQYGDYCTNTESIVLKYKDNPLAIGKALEHRTDLDVKQKNLLARSIAFIHWPDPFEGGGQLG